jgi:hypothetical protein
LRDAAPGFQNPEPDRRLGIDVVRSDFGGDANMAEYRAYIMDKDGLISRAIGLVCPDDETAMEYAKQFVEGHDVELWQHDCRIATFKHKA